MKSDDGMGAEAPQKFDREKEEREHMPIDRIPMASPAGLAAYDAAMKQQAPRWRTIGVVGEELERAMDEAAKVPRLRAELDALLGKKPKMRKAAGK